MLDRVPVLGQASRQAAGLLRPWGAADVVPFSSMLPEGLVGTPEGLRGGARDSPGVYCGASREGQTICSSGFRGNLGQTRGSQVQAAAAPPSCAYRGSLSPSSWKRWFQSTCAEEPQ